LGDLELWKIIVGAIATVLSIWAGVSWVRKTKSTRQKQMVGDNSIAIQSGRDTDIRK